MEDTEGMTHQRFVELKGRGLYTHECTPVRCLACEYQKAILELAAEVSRLKCIVNEKED